MHPKVQPWPILASFAEECSFLAEYFRFVINANCILVCASCASAKELVDETRLADQPFLLIQMCRWIL